MSIQCHLVLFIKEIKIKPILMDPRKKTTQLFNVEEATHPENSEMLEEAIANNDGEDRSELDDIFTDLGI
jgi:hypothetical protein